MVHPWQQQGHWGRCDQFGWPGADDRSGRHRHRWQGWQSQSDHSRLGDAETNWHLWQPSDGPGCAESTGWGAVGGAVPRQAHHRQGSSGRPVVRNLQASPELRHISRTFDQHQLLFVTGETGSGKTTTVPWYLSQNNQTNVWHARSPGACRPDLLPAT